MKYSILESIYLIYMFLFLKTSVDFNALSSPKGWWFEHLIGDEYGLRICPFGRVAIFLLIFILLIRHYIKIPQYCINTALLISFLISLININAIVYLTPVWLYEIYKQIY